VALATSRRLKRQADTISLSFLATSTNRSQTWSRSAQRNRSNCPLIHQQRASHERCWLLVRAGQCPCSRKFEEKAPPFRAGMNPTTGRQPPVLSSLTAYVAVSTTGKNWRLDWGPPGRRRPSHRSREGVSEAVATRQVKSDPRPLVPAHRGTKGRQADGTARARTRGNLRPGASPPSFRDEWDARCKRIPRPSGRRTRHTPRGADASRTNPVSPRRTPFGRREVASGDTGPARCPTPESSRFSAGRMSMPPLRRLGHHCSRRHFPH